MKKVAVLLSAYNGEKYIEQQIDSIKKQSYKNVVIYVRDDGSEDGTKEILQRYADKGDIKFFPGENKGFVGSFLWLVKNCEDADYYCFADQDDVWKENKVERAIKMLEKARRTESGPMVYCSSFDICDSELNVKGRMRNLFEPFTIQKTITSGETGFGMTQMFNHCVREIIMSKPTPVLSNVFGHDTYVHLICLCWGKIIYDDVSGLWYRRHNANTSEQDYHGGNIVTHQLWRIQEFLIRPNGKKVYLDAREFYDLFKEKLRDSDREIFELYMDQSYRLKNVWKKVFYKGRYRKKILDEAAIRICFLIHKM